MNYMYSSILVYYIVSLICWGIFTYRKKKLWLAPLMILLLCPFFGLLLFFSIVRDQNAKTSKLPHWLLREEELSDDNKLIHLDSEKEMNIVPFEDALVLNNSKVKRKMLLDMLKNDSIQKVDFLKYALQNEDSETSHYAATAIMNVKQKLMNSLQALEAEIEKDPNNLEVLVSYSDVVNQYSQLEFLDQRMREKYKYIYSGILEKIIELNPQSKTAFEEKIQCDLYLKEYEKTNYYCNLFIKYFPESEEAYFLSMNMYYDRRDFQKFNETLKSLRDSNVKLSPAGIQRLRFWLKDDSNAS